MQFVSKSARLCVTLRPGIPANPLSGQPNVPGIYIRFQDGRATVNDEKVVAMMLAHAGFNADFVSIEDTQRDPYQNFREEIEPAHSITEMKYGHAEKTLNSQRNRKLSPELEKFINDRAMEMAKSLLPEMMNQVMERVAASRSQQIENAPEAEVEKVKAVSKAKSAPAKSSKPAKKPVKNETKDVEVETTEAS